MAAPTRLQMEEWMPDISMCPSTDCPARYECRRNEASGTQPSHWQSWWSAFEWHTAGCEIECSGFWPVRLATAPATSGSNPDV